MEEERFFEKLKQKRFNRLSNVHIRKYIDIFISLLETKNLRQTCKEMSISLGTASKAINILEEILGSKLFVRKGRKGLLATIEAFKFKEYADKINNVLQITADAFTNSNIDNADNANNNQQQKHTNNHQQHKEKQLIRIACHSLAFKSYILPAIKELNKNNDYCFEILILDRDYGINQMLSDNIDLVMYPIEGRNFAFLQQQCCCELIGEYNLCLFFNKNHPLANKPIEDFTLDDFKSLNIEPNNKHFLFQTYNEIMGTKYRSFNYSTHTSDIHLLKYGLDENFWVLGLGIEFSEIVNCQNYIVKAVKNNSIYSLSINWYCCYNKKNNILRNIEKLIKLIQDNYEGRLSK